MGLFVTHSVQMHYYCHGVFFLHRAAVGGRTSLNATVPYTWNSLLQNIISSLSLL